MAEVRVKLIQCCLIGRCKALAVFVDLLTVGSAYKSLVGLFAAMYIYCFFQYQLFNILM